MPWDDTLICNCFLCKSWIKMIFPLRALVCTGDLALKNLYQYFFDLLKKMSKIKMSNMDAVDFKDLDKFIRQISLSVFHMEKCKVENIYINFLKSGRFFFQFFLYDVVNFFQSHCMHLLFKNIFNYMEHSVH